MSDRAVAVNPDVLRWARERAGLSLPAVAARIKKGEEVVADWETGSESPTFRQLEELADRVYKRPVAIFFFPNPPSEEDARSQFRTLPESEIDTLAPDTRFALREALAFQESVRELTAGTNPATNIFTRDVRPHLGESIEELAAKVRSYLEIPLNVQSAWASTEEAMRRWRRACERVGVFVFKRSFKQRTIFGFCIHDNALPLIVINNSTAHSRQVFTLFHELAHLIYSVSGITKLDMRYIDRMVGRPREIEVACNRFAAEFLVPNPTFPWSQFKRTDLDGFVLSQARRYKVSREVILRRLLDRDLVNQATYLRKTEEWNLQYEQSRRGRAGGNYYATHANYLGESFLRLAFSQYRLGRLSLEQLAGHLRVKARNVSRLEDFVVSGE
jgi:Zn-dependent peptidase ImmA (M78 family)